MLKKYKEYHQQKAETHLEKARKGGIVAVFKLFNRYYIKSFFGPFFSFVFPVVILGILGSIMKIQFVFPGIVAMAALGVGMQGLPFTLIELKKSVIMKRIGASPVKPSTFTFVIITYFTVVIIVSIFWLILWMMVFHHSEALHIFDNLKSQHGVSAIGFIYGNLINIIVSIALGFAIATVSKSEVQAQAIGMLLYFPSTFLSGQFVAIDLIASSPVMNWISMFVPFRYTTMLIVSSWNGDNVFVYHDLWQTVASTTEELSKNIGQVLTADMLAKHVIIYHKYEVILGYIVPYAMLAGAGVFSVIKFRWSNAR